VLLVRHLLSVTSYRNTMLYLAAAQGSSWALSWMLLRDFYSPEEIQHATKMHAEETSETIETGAIIVSPISDGPSEGLKSPDSTSTYLQTLDMTTEKPPKITVKLSETTMTIAADRWRYSIIPRFQYYGDKTTFWSLLLGISICTL
jgi:hypothetical protein